MKMKSSESFRLRWMDCGRGTEKLNVEQRPPNIEYLREVCFSFRVGRSMFNVHFGIKNKRIVGYSGSFKNPPPFLQIIRYVLDLPGIENILPGQPALAGNPDAVGHIIQPFQMMGIGIDHHPEP